METPKSWRFEPDLEAPENQISGMMTGPWGVKFPLNCTNLVTSMGQVAYINLPNQLNDLTIGATGYTDYYTRDHIDKYITQSNGYVFTGMKYLELHISEIKKDTCTIKNFLYSGKDKVIIHTDYCDKLQKFIKDTFEMDVKITLNKTNLTFELQTAEKTLTFSNKSGEFCKISTCAETSLRNTQEISFDKIATPGDCIPQMVASLELFTEDNPPQDLFEQAVSHMLSPLKNFSINKNKPTLFKRFIDDKKYLAISLKYEIIEAFKEFVMDKFPFVHNINITVSKLIKTASITCEPLPNIDHRRYFQIASNLQKPTIRFSNVSSEAQEEILHLVHRIGGIFVKTAEGIAISMSDEQAKEFHRILSESNKSKSQMSTDPPRRHRRGRRGESNNSKPKSQMSTDPPRRHRRARRARRAQRLGPTLSELPAIIETSSVDVSSTECEEPLTKRNCICHD
tara:strand:+ start:238 stop:1599 length:1362 start_codon:yes stop_codon:yes gene_type:complete